MSSTCLYYASIHQNRLEPSPTQEDDGQNIAILPFSKPLNDWHCAAYKWKYCNVRLMHASCGIQWNSYCIYSEEIF